MIPEKSEVLIYRAARRAAAEWSAGENLRKKLLARGLDAKTTQAALTRLADTIRSK